MCLEAGHDDAEGAAEGGPGDAPEGLSALQGLDSVHGRNATKGLDAQGIDRPGASLTRREAAEAPQAMTPLERNMFRVLEEEERRSKNEGKNG